MGAIALQDYAIVVGVTYAPTSGFDALGGTQRDAAAFTEWLLASDGGNVPKENIVPLMLAGAKGTPPGQDRIDATLEAIGINGAQRPIGRRLYFYFSGHGLGMNWDEICMLMDGATSGKLNVNIGLQRYRDFMRALSFFEEVVYFLDCCRNPAAPSTGVDPRPPSFTFAPPPAGLVSDVVVAAAPGGFKSFEITDAVTGQRRGLFTTALLEVLSSPLGVDVQGQHTALNLQKNLRDKVAAIVKRNDLEDLTQFPTLDISDHRGTGLVLAKSAIAPVTVRITAPDGTKGRLVVLENNILVVDRRFAGKATKDKPPWRVQLLPSRLYSVRHTRGQKLSADAPIDWSSLKGPDKDGEYEFVLPQAKPSRRER